MINFRKLRELPRSIWILSFAILVNRMGSMAVVYLSLYITKFLGYSMSIAGLVFFVYGLTSIFAVLLAGRLVDRYGGFSILQISLFVSGLVLLVFPWANHVAGLLILTVLLALSTESLRPASKVLLYELSSPNQKVLSLALYRLAINVGMSIGPTVGGFLAVKSYNWVFWIDGLTTWIALFLLVVTKVSAEAKKIRPIVKKITDDVLSKVIYKDKVFLIFILSTLPLMFTMMQMNSSLPLYVVKQLGYSEAQFGFLMLINTLMVVGLEIPIVMYLKKYSMRSILSLGSLFYGLGYFGFVVSKTLFLMPVCIALITLGEIFFVCASTTYLFRLAPVKQQGEYVGWYGMTHSLGLMIAPALGVWLFEGLGASTLWVITFCTAVLSAVLFFKCVDKKIQLEENYV